MSDKINPKLQAAQELSEKIGAIEFIKAGTTANATVERSVFDATLPEGITPAIVDTIDTHRQNYNSAAAYAAGEASLKAFVSDKALESTQVTFQTGEASGFEIGFSREAKFTDPKDPKGEKLVRHMTSTSAAFNGENERGAGSLKQVLSHFKEMGAQSLAKSKD